jgi:ubiquitin-protein ligase
MTKKEITNETKKRLIKDVVDVIKNPLTDQGIYYVHDEDNMLHGYAMLIGQKDTPYENGIYFLNLKFPYNYPYSPPKLEYLTNDGKTRFNPNLYRNGKVCLSILNTWRGEQWTSCQTIRTILLTLITVLNDKPLLNEPGIKESNKDFKIYNKIINYKNYEIAMYDVLTKKLLPTKHITFYSIIKNHFLKNKGKIIKKINKDKDKYIKDCLNNPPTWSVRIYSMICTPDYINLINNLENAFNNIKLK